MIRLRTALWALLPLALMAHKCRESVPATSAPALDAKWVLQTLQGQTVEVPDGREIPWLQIAGDELNGFNGCNKVMGGVKLDGPNIDLGQLGSTKMYCEDTAELEKKFMTALRGVDSYKLKGDMLQLLGGGKELLTLKR